MPKAPTSIRQDSDPFNTKNMQNLRRNQACHQCRRRKLKCDAKRPCSTCVRSHAYALAHAPPSDRLNIPEHPECTYDDVTSVPPPQPAPQAPKSRYERLENRINELENLLRENSGRVSRSSSTGIDKPSPQTSMAAQDDFGTLPDSSHSPSLTGSFDGDAWSKAFFLDHGRGNGQGQNSLTSFSGPLDQLAGVASLIQATDHASIPTPSSSNAFSVDSPLTHGENATSSFAPSRGEQAASMLYMSWPQNLPDVSTTRHLVQAFFAHYMHAHRMFHVSTFMASLDLHPADPKFPAYSVLHAMCAIGSLYASPTLYPAVANVPYGSLSGTGFGKKRASNFAEQQVIFAREEAEGSLAVGEQLFENAQTLMLLTWYYQSHARWIEACLCNAMSIRTTVPCALNVCPPFHGISSTGPFSDKPQTILPSARTVLEDETRRNSFWVAYSIERQLGAGNGWAMLLDDRDVAQLLPLREDQYEKALLVLPPDRQWSHAKDTLLSHPPDQTDSFILHVKSSMLFSQVKNFNIRFKSLAYAGDSRHTPATVGDGNWLKDPPKTTASFRELDKLIDDFRNNIPTRFRNPLAEGKIDHYLFSAWNLMHLTQIHFHEPYSKPNSSSCSSALKIITAARAIVDLSHSVSSSSFDVSLLDIYPFLAWFMAGRVLVRFLKAAMEAQAEDKVLCLKAEIVFLRTNLIQAGTRIPLAATYAKMLDNMFVSTCNEEETSGGGNFVEHFGSSPQLEEAHGQAPQDPQPLTSEEMMMPADYPINHILLPA